MLRARGLVKAYPGPDGAPIPVLRGIDLDVKAGQLAVIAGASGSGKSTLLNVLGLLEDADDGQVWFGDDLVSARSRNGKSRARGRSVGFVFQSFQLLPALTALDNVLLAARYVPRPGVDARRRAEALLETFPQACALAVDAMCLQPYPSLGNRSLAQVMPFGAKEQQMIEEAARRLAAGTDPGIIPARFLIGAARVAVDTRIARPGKVAENFYKELARR